MPIYKLKLLNRKEVARGTLVFEFEKPEGFNFKPGQYGGFTHIPSSPIDPSALTRRFSLLSTPQDNHIAIATRMQQSEYKRLLNELEIGSEMKFAGPTGNFTLHEDTQIPAVMIAGGIGITPFFSMIELATKQKSSQPIILFYGNQTLADTAFIQELTQHEKDNPHFKFIPVFANPDASWQGEKGYITDDILKKYISDLSKPIYYVCGSPAMIIALRETLNELEIPEEKIRTEDFPGY